jgi:hypothetical protein
MKHGKLKKFFFEQRVRVLAKLPEIHKAMFGNEKTHPLTIKALDDIWNSTNEDGKLMEKLKPLLVSDLDFGGAQLWQEISAADDFNLAPNDAIEFLGKRKNVISGINATTWDSLKTSLQEGLKNGESYDDLADRVKTLFTGASEGRAQTIALTETQVAVNSGRQLAMVQSGF